MERKNKRKKRLKNQYKKKSQKTLFWLISHLSEAKKL
jgi:hypothetical protein